MPWKNWRANTFDARLLLQYLRFYRLMYFNWSPDNSHKKIIAPAWSYLSDKCNANGLVLINEIRFQKNEYEERGVAL